MKSISKHLFALLLCASMVLLTQCKKENAIQKEAVSQDVNQRQNLTTSSQANALSQGSVQDPGTFSTIIFNCVEDVNVTGVYHFVYIPDKVTNSGRLSGGLHLDAQGTGIGVSSASKYLWRDNWTEHLNIAITTDDAGHYTYRHNLRIIGTGGASSFEVIEVINITVNANGVITVNTFSFTSKPC